jgi:PGF-pre-PGF domain-containing protein
MKKVTASLLVLVLALVVAGTANFCAALGEGGSPPAPQLVSPPNGTLVTIDSLTLKWNAIPHADSYDVSYIRETDKNQGLDLWAAFEVGTPNLSQCLSSTEYTISKEYLRDTMVYNLAYDDTFYWRVQAHVDMVYYWPHSSSPYSEEWCFHVLKWPAAWIDNNYWDDYWEIIWDNSLLPRTLTGPCYWGSDMIPTTTSHTPHLSWTDRYTDERQKPVSFADRYRVQLSASPTFGSLIADITTENISYTTPELSPGAYYWRVRSETNDGLVTEWITPRKFIIESGPGVTTDSDGDGMLDSWETQYGLDPYYAGDASQDTDGDGYTNLQEYQAGTDPTSASSHPGGVTQPVVLPAAVTVTNIPAKLGQTISVGENGVASVDVCTSTMVQVNFENEQPVDSITIFTDAAMETVSARVEQLSQKPAGVPEPTASLPGMIVSHYMEIEVTPTAAASVHVENSWIDFRVSKSWLSNNNIDPLRMYLLRYSNGQWYKNHASLLEKEDATYMYYFAVAPGFSTFAVAGEAALSGQTQPFPTTTVFIAILAVAIVVGVIATIIRLRRH